MKIPLFDIDGTLLKGGSGNLVHRAGFDYAFKQVFGLDGASVSEIRTDGKIDKQIIAEVVALHNVSDKEIDLHIDRTVSSIVEYYLKHAQEAKCEAAAGAVDLLEDLKQLIPLGLLTGNIGDIAWDKLMRAGLKDYFSFGAFGDMAMKRVDLIARARDEVNRILGTHYQIEDFVIVGDSTLDVACAKDGGIEVIGVVTGNYSKEDLLKVGADLVVESLEQRDEIKSFLSL